MWQGLTGFVRAFVTATTAAANAVVDSSVGSLTLAFAQAVTGAALFLQAQVAKVLLLARASTSKGADLDSFLNGDWNFARLGAGLATGQATFGRFTPTLQAVVPIGAVISSGIGSQQYVVTLDTANAYYSQTLDGYVLAPTIASISCPISALIAGSIGNAPANTITTFIQPISGIDTVTNAEPLTNGSDAESDSAYLSRWWQYIQSLRAGTVAAIRTAVMSLQIGIACTVLENIHADLSADNGFLTVVVDDGSGTPSSTILNAAGSQVDSVRAAGIRFAVTTPSVVMATIVLTVISAVTAQHAADQAAAQTAILDYVNSLPQSTSLVWARVFQVAFNSSTNIEAITGLTINGASSDLTATAIQRIMSTSVTVS